MRIHHEKGVETPQDINLMPTPPTINALTITRSKVQFLGDEEDVDPAQGQPMETKTEAKGQPSSSQRVGGRARSRASSSLAVPPAAFYNYS